MAKTEAKFTIELSAQDRALLKRLADAVEALSDPKLKLDAKRLEEAEAMASRAANTADGARRRLDALPGSSYGRTSI